MSKVESKGYPIIVPWRGDGVLDIWEITWNNTPERLSKLTKLHCNLFPLDKEKIKKGDFAAVHKNVKKMCNYGLYKLSPIYWFLQFLNETVFVYCVFTSCLIQNEMTVQGKKFNGSVREIVENLLKKAMEYAKWDYGELEKFEMDDMFPLLNMETSMGAKEIKQTRNDKRRSEKIPERLIPIFNLPFIYCQLYTETSLETMRITIRNLGIIYEEKKEETMYGSSLAWIESIRLMKIQMEQNLASVANHFKPPMYYIADVNRMIHMESQIKSLQRDVYYWKNRALKNGNKKTENGKRKIEKDDDMRIPKLGPKIELPNFHSSDDEIEE